MTLAERRAASSQFSGVELVANTGTFYAEKGPRFDLALETLGNYATAGVPVVVVDSSHLKGHDWVAKELRRTGAVVKPAIVGGIASQRRQAAQYSLRHGADAILSAEPEKDKMPNFVDDITEALRTNDAVSIGRTEAAMQSLPPVQHRTEKLGGWVFQQLLDVPADPWSGGRAFTAEGAQSLITYPAGRPGMDNWIWLYDTMLGVQGRGMNIGSIAVDLMHPETMVTEETGNPVFDKKRYDQFDLQVRWAAKQPEVNTTENGQAVSEIVMGTLQTLPEKPSNAQFEDAFSSMEEQFAPLGYQPPARQ